MNDFGGDSERSVANRDSGSSTGPYSGSSEQSANTTSTPNIAHAGQTSMQGNTAGPDAVANPAGNKPVVDWNNVRRIQAPLSSNEAPTQQQVTPPADKTDVPVAQPARKYDTFAADWDKPINRPHDPEALPPTATQVAGKDRILATQAPNIATNKDVPTQPATPEAVIPLNEIKFGPWPENADYLTALLETQRKAIGVQQLVMKGATVSSPDSLRNIGALAQSQERLFHTTTNLPFEFPPAGRKLDATTASYVITNAIQQPTAETYANGGTTVLVTLQSGNRPKPFAIVNYTQDQDGHPTVYGIASATELQAATGDAGNICFIGK